MAANDSVSKQSVAPDLQNPAEARHTPGPHEIVPAALRQRLRWDSRHDAMAAQIIEEFKLQLPRDRELIRQLAFVRVQQKRPDDSGGGFSQSETSDYAAWLAENPAPDLQELVAKHGGYNKITPEAWAAYDAAMEAWRKRYALRAIGESRAKRP